MKTKLRDIAVRDLSRISDRIRIPWRSKFAKPKSWNEDYPFCSPNIWEYVVRYYQRCDPPTVCEYGVGISSLHHIRNLLRQGGTYIGVEHNQSWFLEAIRQILAFAVARHYRVKVTVDRQRQKRSWMDAEFQISEPGHPPVRATIKLRPPNRRYRGGDGYFEQFRDYVEVLEENCNVVVVDGRARNACIRHVLHKAKVAPGGMLALFDAWRGFEEYNEREVQSDPESNYKEAVQELQRLGGFVVDGEGFDTWTGLTYRRAPRQFAYSCPREACLLVR